MPSQLTWIDHDASERDRMTRILALFQERETRDELGLGGIRDSIADLLFPGTSTIQTRLRYFFFVPWICSSLEGEGLAPDAMAAAVREREYALRCALLETDDTLGVIGSQAGADLKRGPSSVYWAGLGTWGLRRFDGFLEDYYRSLPLILRARGRHDAPDDEDGPVDRHHHTWHPDLPPVPEGFPARASLALTLEEAAFLRDLITRRAEGTLLAALFARADARIPDVDQPWAWPDLARLDAPLREQLDHARWFSLVMNGAALLYNLLLAQKGVREDRIQEHAARLDDWTARIAASPLESWSLARFWEIVWNQGHTITPRSQRFVEEWVSEVRAGTSHLVDRPSARVLIERRESQLKGPRSRFRNPRALDQWGGSSGVTPLDYRWSTVRRYLQDLHAALVGPGETKA